MTENDMLQFQMDQIDRLVTINNWSVGIFITLILAIVGFLGFLQLRLSDKQIQNMKVEIDNELNKKYNLKAINDIENTTLVINQAVSNSIIVLGKQVFSIAGPNYNSIMEFRGLIDPLYKFEEIDRSLSIFLMNTIEKILNEFQKSQESTMILNKSYINMKKSINKRKTTGELVLFDAGESDEIIIEDKYFHDVKVILLEILEIIKNKSKLSVIEDMDFEKTEEKIKNFERK